jgi:hypothetical protein
LTNKRQPAKHKCPVTHELEIAITTAIVPRETITLAIDDIIKTIGFAAKRSRSRSELTVMTMISKRDMVAGDRSVLRRDVVNREAMRQLKWRKKKMTMKRKR